MVAGRAFATPALIVLVNWLPPLVMVVLPLYPPAAPNTMVWVWPPLEPLALGVVKITLPAPPVMPPLKESDPALAVFLPKEIVELTPLFAAVIAPGMMTPVVSAPKVSVAALAPPRVRPELFCKASTLVSESVPALMIVAPL